MATPASVATSTGGSCATACSSANAYAKGGARSALLDTIIQSNSFPARDPAHKLFAKIAGNILANPTDPKFRKLNVQKIIAKFGAGFVGIAELMRSVGFVADGANLVLPETTETEALCQALCSWNDREARSAAARAEAARVTAENLKDVAADKAKKEAHRANIKSLGEQARKEVASKPINDSKPQPIKFGASLAKVQPPPPAPKGG